MLRLVTVDLRPTRSRRFWSDPFNRHVAVAVALKFGLLALLWLAFVRDVRWTPDASAVSDALVPPAARAAESPRSPAP